MINTIFNILLFIPTPIRGKVAQKSEIQTHMCTTHIFNNTPFFGVRAPPGTYFYPQKNRAKNNFHRKNGVLLVPHFHVHVHTPETEPSHSLLLFSNRICDRFRELFAMGECLMAIISNLKDIIIIFVLRFLKLQNI